MIRYFDASAFVKRYVHAESRHPLRAADALHLAAALMLQSKLGRTEFVVYDEKLAAAVRLEKLPVLP